MSKKTGSLIIGYDFSKDENNGILIVGTRTKGQNTDIVNAFQGKEAKAIFERLITVKKEA